VEVKNRKHRVWAKRGLGFILPLALALMTSIAFVACSLGNGTVPLISSSIVPSSSPTTTVETSPALVSITLTPISPTTVNPSFLTPPTPYESGVSIEVVGTYSDGSTSNVSSITQAEGVWISSNPQVAAVLFPGVAGRVQALNYGTTQITFSLFGITSSNSITVTVTSVPQNAGN
jgi:hypothetical protein